MIPLRATARLQLHAGFDLDAATAQVPYYDALGISHLYLSPIGTAVPGSTHGYDNTDPGTVNAELGGEPALLRLSHAARARGMGLLLDIVPNHMAAHPANAWWWDVLRLGRRSRHAGWFDIDWRAPGRDGRLWLPVLDRPYAQALRDGVLQVVEHAGEAQLAHHDQRFPLGLPARELPAEAQARQRWLQALNADAVRGGDALHRLLQRQPYRLAWWRVGNDMLNYRRFFDITSLVALRVEQPAVFDAVHALPLRLVAEGHVDGLRVDHVDGLSDPRAYLRRLRSRLDAAGRRRGIAAGGIALYVEKILAPGETLPADWACDGTTGYDFMDQAGALLHPPAGQAPLTALWQRGSGRSGVFAEEERQARDEVLRTPLQAEFTRTVEALSALARLDPQAAEFSPQMLARALCVLLRWFPVYRTYAGRDGLDAVDTVRLEAAAAAARDGLPVALDAALAAIVRWLRDDRGATRAQLALRRIARRRVEQLSAPLNAKAVEDTAFYRHGVLLSRNEVGSHPDHFALDPAGFHAACQARAARHPRALLATATHDHKRGEDVRARLAVLAAQPRWWTQQVRRLETLARGCGGDAVAGGDRLMLWQTAVAAWPLALTATDSAGLQAYATRLAQWQCKALREAKLFSSWTDPRSGYEDAARHWLEALLLGRGGAGARRLLQQAAAAIAPAGARNGLVQATLRLTAPGVPDLYQGGEGWDLSLVDPDNRRPVDYARRAAWLDDPRDWHALLHDWHDGAVKARLLARLLALRRVQPALFARGDYRTLAAPRRAGWLAFRRQHAGTALVVAVALRPAAASEAALMPSARHWGTAMLPVPAGRYRDVLAERDLHSTHAGLAASTLFARSPVAVLLTT
jgi:(1->4)-alpha-D-glucan 1-alpha-D-glucosylmutase